MEPEIQVVDSLAWPLVNESDAVPAAVTYHGKNGQPQVRGEDGGDEPDLEEQDTAAAREPYPLVVVFIVEDLREPPGEDRLVGEVADPKVCCW